MFLLNSFYMYFHNDKYRSTAIFSPYILYTIEPSFQFEVDRETFNTKSKKSLVQILQTSMPPQKVYTHLYNANFQLSSFICKKVNLCISLFKYILYNKRAENSTGAFLILSLFFFSLWKGETQPQHRFVNIARNEILRVFFGAGRGGGVVALRFPKSISTEQI